MNSMDFHSLWMGFLELPFSGLLVIIACVVLLCVVIGLVFRLISRLFFRPLRFAVCLLIGGLILGASGTLLYRQPIVSKGESETNAQIMELAASTFKGIYNNKLPLLAWRIHPADTDKETASDPLSEETSAKNETILLPGSRLSDQNADMLATVTSPVLIEVSYLPFGKMVLEYNPFTQSFAVREGLGVTGSDSFVGDLLSAVGPIQPAALTKTLTDSTFE